MVSAADHENTGKAGRQAGESWRALAGKYVAAFSGDGARIFIQLFYFYIVANTLSIAEFGLFATVSSIGIVLSRITAFGFFSPLYRVVTVKPQLLGVYTAGYIAAMALSVPVILAIGAIIYFALFAADMPLWVFAMIAGSEIFFWRTLELVITINRGLERFGRASVVVVFGFTIKALAALVLALSPVADLAHWAVIYFIAQAALGILSVIIFYPLRRLRFRPKLYWRRAREALSVCGAELLFYAQSELDKVVVLVAGGPVAAGLYAIVIRLVDLTAMPVRTFSILLAQRLMRQPELLASIRKRAVFEAGVFTVSTAAILAMVAVFAVKPDILGDNVAEAGSLLAFALLLPAFRNLIEYQSELLYGRGQTVTRMVNYAIVGAVKAALLLAVMSAFSEPADWLFWTNAVFAVLYALSFVLTYRAMARPAVRA